LQNNNSKLENILKTIAVAVKIVSLTEVLLTLCS
jgi:hypothetical protein